MRSYVAQEYRELQFEPTDFSSCSLEVFATIDDLKMFLPQKLIILDLLNWRATSIDNLSFAQLKNTFTGASTTLLDGQDLSGQDRHRAGPGGGPPQKNPPGSKFRIRARNPGSKDADWVWGRREDQFDRSAQSVSDANPD